MFEAADRDPALVDQGALTFVVVGGGPTGVELAGALADLIAETMTAEYHHLAVSAAQIHLVDLGHALLGPFSDRAHDYAAKILGRKGVRLHMGVAVTEVGPGHVSLADGSTIRTRCVVWGGGIQAPAVAATGGLPRGRGGRIEVQAGPHGGGALPASTSIGDMANIPGPDGSSAAAARLGRAAERHVGGREHPGRRRRQAAQAVPLPRQGHHGDDRPRRGDRRGGSAPPRAARRDRVLRLARRPRLADDRRPQPHRRVRRLGLGLLHRGPRPADTRPAGRRRRSTGTRTWRPNASPPPRRDGARHPVGVDPRRGAEPDGVHARVPHHPGVAGRGPPGDHADRQPPRPCAATTPTRCCSPGAGRRSWR